MTAELLRPRTLYLLFNTVTPLVAGLMLVAAGYAAGLAIA